MGKRLGLCGVFDGHCGGAVSRLAAKQLPEMLRKAPSFKKRDYPAALREAFLAMDKHLDSSAGRQVIMRLARGIRRDLADQLNVQCDSPEAEGLNFEDLYEDLCSDNPDS